MHEHDCRIHPCAGEDGRDGGRRGGFTLVEVLVALSLFSLIGLAGLAVVRTVLDAQARTAPRIQRLNDIQRAMLLVSSDLDQMSGLLVVEPTTIRFQKTDGAARPLLIAYVQQGDRLVRVLSSAQGVRPQVVLDRVSQARWSVYRQGAGWGPSASPQTRGVQPVSAVALDLSLTGPAGGPVTARRVVATPDLGS